MAFDGITIANMVYELNTLLSQGRISKIAQPEKDELLLTIKSPQGSFRLLLSADPSLPILYLADSSTDYPLKKGIVDLNLDFFAVNEHLFYHDDFLLDRLSPYLKEDGRILGTWFYFKNGQRSMKLLK